MKKPKIKAEFGLKILIPKVQAKLTGVTIPKPSNINLVPFIYMSISSIK